MVKFQPHPAPDETRLQHTSAPGRAGDRNRNRLGAELRMAPDQRPVVTHEHGGITVMLCLDEQDGSRLEVVQKNAAFNLRLHNVGVDAIAKIGVGLEHTSLQVSVQAGSPLHRRLHYSPGSQRRKVISAAYRLSCSPIVALSAYPFPHPAPSSPASRSIPPGSRLPSPTRADLRG